MKNFVIILFAGLIFSSCKENVVNGFTADSVKKDLTTKLNNSKWTATDNEAFYSDVMFENQIIVLQKVGGGTSRSSFEVTNITSPRVDMPDTIQLRLKNSNAIDEVYITKDYSKMKILTKVNKEDIDIFESNYMRK